MKLVTKLFQSKSKHRFHGCLDDQAVRVDAHVVEEQKREADHTATNSCLNEFRDDIDMKYAYWNKDTQHLNDTDVIDTSSICQRTYNSILNRSWHRGSITTDNTNNNARSKRHRKTIADDKYTNKVASNSFTSKNASNKYSTNATSTGAKSVLSSSSSTSKSSKLELSSTLSSVSATDSRTNTTTTTTSLLDETSSSSNVSMFNDDTTGTAAPTSSSSCDITKNTKGRMRSKRTSASRGKQSTPKQNCAPWRVENILPNGKTFNESDWWRTTAVVPTNRSVDINILVDNNNDNTNNSSFPTHSSTDDDDEGICYDDALLLEHQKKEEPFINAKADNNTELPTTFDKNFIEPELLSSNIDTNDDNTLQNKSKSTKPTRLVSRTNNDTIVILQETFYNCGYATWVQVRYAWKNPKTFVPTTTLPPPKRSTLSQQMISNLKTGGEKTRNRSKSTNNSSPTTNASNDHDTKIKSSSSKYAPPQNTTNATVNSTTTTVFVPDSVKRDLVKCIKERRHFELSRSIPLKIIITAYNEAWADGEGL